MSQSIMDLRAQALANVTAAYHQNLAGLAEMPEEIASRESRITDAFMSIIRQLAFPQLHPDGGFSEEQIRELANPNSDLYQMI